MCRNGIAVLLTERMGCYTPMILPLKSTSSSILHRMAFKLTSNHSPSYKHNINLSININNSFKLRIRPTFLCPTWITEEVNRKQNPSRYNNLVFHMIYSTRTIPLSFKPTWMRLTQWHKHTTSKRHRQLQVLRWTQCE